MFKADPKKQVSLKFVELFGRTVKHAVTGVRLTPEQCSDWGYRPVRGGLYLTELIVEGHILATAVHSDWRKSYKLLRLEVEKLYAEGADVS